MAREAIESELERIRRESGGVLRAEDVVEAASDEGSPLHGEFEWDDTEAAQKWRLAQARTLIRVCVTIINPEKDPVHTYVSLLEDREHGGGYRHVVEVMQDDHRRRSMLQEAMRDLSAWKRKYRNVSELAATFDVIDAATENVTEVVKKPKKAKG